MQCSWVQVALVQQSLGLGISPTSIYPDIEVRGPGEA